MKFNRNAGKNRHAQVPPVLHFALLTQWHSLILYFFFPIWYNFQNTHKKISYMVSHIWLGFSSAITRDSQPAVHRAQQKHLLGWQNISVSLLLKGRTGASKDCMNHFSSRYNWSYLPFFLWVTALPANHTSPVVLLHICNKSNAFKEAKGLCVQGFAYILCFQNTLILLSTCKTAILYIFNKLEFSRTWKVFITFPRQWPWMYTVAYPRVWHRLYTMAVLWS